MHDEMGEHITMLGEEMEAMRYFVREAKRREFDDKETDAMAHAAVNHYGELKSKLRHLAGHRGYNGYVLNNESDDDHDDIDVDALRERFVKKVYNDRFDAALPYVYKAYMKQKQEGLESPMGNQFEDWANEVVEGAWQLPNDPEESKAMDELMSNPITFEDDAINVIGLLRGFEIFKDQALFDKLRDVASAEGPESDARPTIIQWLRDNGYAELADKYDSQYTQNDTGMQNQPGVVAGQQQQAQSQQVGGVGTAEPSPAVNPRMQESRTNISESIGDLRRLAGLK